MVQGTGCVKPPGAAGWTQSFYIGRRGPVFGWIRIVLGWMDAASAAKGAGMICVCWKFSCCEQELGLPKVGKPESRGRYFRLRICFVMANPSMLLPPPAGAGPVTLQDSPGLRLGLAISRPLCGLFLWWLWCPLCGSSFGGSRARFAGFAFGGSRARFASFFLGPG